MRPRTRPPAPSPKLRPDWGREFAGYRCSEAVTREYSLSFKTTFDVSPDPHLVGGGGCRGFGRTPKEATRKYVSWDYAVRVNRWKPQVPDTMTGIVKFTRLGEKPIRAFVRETLDGSNRMGPSGDCARPFSSTKFLSVRISSWGLANMVRSGRDQSRKRAGFPII